jgi:hypothetical protein
MQRMRFAMLSVLAALALSAVASSTAMATHEFFVNEKTIGKGEKIEVDGNQMPGGNLLEGTVAKLQINIACQANQLPAGSADVLEEAGKFKIKSEYKGCTVSTVSGGTVENQPKCKLKEFAAEGSGELIESGTMRVKGSPLGTVHIEEVSGAGACALAGEFKMEGTQACTVPNSEVVVTVLTVACNPAGSKELKLGAEPTKLTSTVSIAGTKGQKICLS